MKKNHFLITAILLLTPALTHAQFTNWPVAAGGNGHYYEAVLAPGITWSNANLAASNRGGYLVTITSSNENNFVFGYVKADVDLWHQSSTGNWWGPWLGAFQPQGSSEPGGGWQWVSSEAFSYTNWTSGQPNNSGGSENRIQFGGQKTLAGTWNDVNEASTANMRSYIIEYDVKPNEVPDVFFGEYVSPYPYDLARTVPRPTNLAAVIQTAARFRSRLLTPGMASFEQYTTNTSLGTLSFGSVSAEISGTNYIGGIADPAATHVGVFPFSGTNYLNLTANVSLTVTFSSPQAAFGFAGTDSETNRVLLTLITVDHGDIQLTVPVTKPQGTAGAFFFGVLAVDTPFRAVRITNTGSEPDGLALDDMVVANVSQIITLPTLAIHASSREICWDTVNNAGYQLQYTTNLAVGIWTPVYSGYYPGSGGVFSTNYAISVGQPRLFYRVVVTNSIP